MKYSRVSGHDVCNLFSHDSRGKNAYTHICVFVPVYICKYIHIYMHGIIKQMWSNVNKLGKLGVGSMGCHFVIPVTFL